MKTNITLFFLLLFSIGFAQNADKSYDLLQEKTTTKILYDRVFGISNATQIPKEPVSANYFKQVYHEIQRADFLGRLPAYQLLKDQTALGTAQKQVPISILVSDFESIKKSALANGDVAKNGNQVQAKTGAAIFDTHHLTLIAPLVPKIRTSSAAFILKDNLIFNTTNKAITSVAANFNTGKGWQTVVTNQSLKVRFTESGKKKIDFKITFQSGEIVLQSAEIEVELTAVADSATNKSVSAILPVTSTIPYQGYDESAAFNGQGDYEIFPDNGDGVLDKPIFLIDGFDPGDARPIANIYDYLDYGTGNLADDLRDQGFDIVILNFPTYTRPATTTVIDGGADYIQRNAMVLVELINQINAQKVGTEKNVVIGPSMGGLISRYALRYMEMNSMDSDTRLYISFDAPHLGANVPIGMQHLFNYMAYGPLGDVTVQGIVDGLLKSPAAREMLIDQFEGHLQTGSLFAFDNAIVLPTGKPNYRTAFQTELNTMGFPTSVRNVSIANGAGNGTMNGTPNMVVMDHTFNITDEQRAIINLRFTPTANTQNQVSRLRLQIFVGIWFTLNESLANSKAPTYTDGLDSAPGGRFSLAGFADGGTNPLLDEFFDNLLIDYFDFIPTNSSMAVSSTTNLYAPVTGATVTPFAAQYIPTINENHVTLTAANMAFALNEILNPPLAVPAHELFTGISVKNPIGMNIEIYTEKAIANAVVSLTDVSGKTIFSRTGQNIEGNYQIPVSLSNGMYVLTIKNKEGNFTKKLVKN